MIKNKLKKRNPTKNKVNNLIGKKVRVYDYNEDLHIGILVPTDNGFKVISEFQFYNDNIETITGNSIFLSH